MFVQNLYRLTIYCVLTETRLIEAIVNGVKVFGHSQMVTSYCVRVLRRLQTISGSDTPYIHTSNICDSLGQMVLQTPYKSCQVAMLYDDWCLLLLVTGCNK